MSYQPVDSSIPPPIMGSLHGLESRKKKAPIHPPMRNGGFPPTPDSCSPMRNSHCDVTIHCAGNRTFRAHRLILMSCSPVLRRLIKEDDDASTIFGGKGPHNHTTLILTNDDAYALYILVNAMYVEQLNLVEWGHLSIAAALNIWLVAKKYGMRRAQEKIVREFAAYCEGDLKFKRRHRDMIFWINFAFDDTGLRSRMLETQERERQAAEHILCDFIMLLSDNEEVQGIECFSLVLAQYLVADGFSFLGWDGSEEVLWQYPTLATDIVEALTKESTTQDLDVGNELAAHIDEFGYAQPSPKRSIEEDLIDEFSPPQPPRKRTRFD